MWCRSDSLTSRSQLRRWPRYFSGAQPLDFPDRVLTGQANAEASREAHVVMTSKSDHVGPDHVGTFVRTALGIGRLVAVNGRTALVRYFHAPGRTPYVEHTHAVAETASTALPTHTRAYLYDGQRWRIGRVEGTHPQDASRFLIAFPNSEGAVLGAEAFDVRWSMPIADPFDVLASVGGDSPLVYESRLGFLSAWAKQRAASTGVEGLLLGSVELHAHQLRAVRRVAVDPVKRYLLADEVGLGKTIEAGALIWQFMATCPTGRVLVLAPDHLREQWASELLDRFRTHHYSKSWLRIRSLKNESSWPDQPVDLLVIDEAHHVTRTGPLSQTARQRITRLAHDAQSLLLLSATPVRSNEAGFLDLLHLLDPDHYQPDQLADFVRRVDLRDQLALTYQSLTPDIDEFDLSLYADELRRSFPEDRLLGALLDNAAVADDKTRADRVGRLREHLSETYRLHHRLLRTRRTPEAGSTLAVRGRRRAVPFTLEVTDPTDGLRRELLDSIRNELNAAVETGRLSVEEAIDTLREMAARCGSLSHALLAIFGLDGSKGSDSPADRLLKFVDYDIRIGWRTIVEDIHTAHAQVVNELGEVLSTSTVAKRLARVVIASSFTESAGAVAAEMVRRWGSDRVAMHLLDQPHETNSSELDRWSDEGPCSLLVCDSGAEEGINLQSADLLVHLDLPWEALRVEQRIGRCDRHAAGSTEPIPSTVVIFADQPYALAWLEFLADGCSVFTRSVSSLQYVLGDTERAIQQCLLRRGPSALLDAVESQATTLASEEVRIAAHDALDAIDPPSRDNGDRSDDALLASDCDPTLASALTSWFEGVGAGVRHPVPGAVRVDRRRRPQIPFDLELAITPFFESTLALERKAAVERALPVLRAGHPLVDAIAAHLWDSDRGIAFAMFRPAPGQWPPVVVLRTDFVVSLHAASTFVATADALGLRAWVSQTTNELAPPLVETVVFTKDGSEVTHPALRRPYDKQRGDLNLGSRPDLFERLTANIEWSAISNKALSLAHACLAKRPSVAERRKTAAAAFRGRIGQLADRDRARALAGPEFASLEWDRLEAAAPNELEPKVDVIGCGVIFVGDPAKLE